MKKTIGFLFTLPFLFCFIYAANAQAGTLDSTFGGTGIVQSPQGSNSTALVVQPDGKIITAGYTFRTNSFTVIRYKKTGKYDKTFGLNGVVQIPFDTLQEVSSVALQTDGKILIAGSGDKGYYINVIIVRLNTNGTIDSSFGIDGKSFSFFNNSNSFVKCLSVLSDGKILVSGYSNNGWIYPDFTVARYNSNGQLDLTFGNKGFVQTNLGNTTSEQSIDEVYKHVVQADGKIIVTGVKELINGPSYFATVRYNQDGSIDSSFGMNGKLVSTIGYSSSVAVFKRKIIVAGYLYNAMSNYNFVLIRYKANGNIDSSFGNSGIVVTDFNNGADFANAMAIQPDGKIVVTGSAWNSATGYDFALIRYNKNGSIDNSFGTNGKVLTTKSNTGTLDEAYDIALDYRSGKILITGYGSGAGFTTIRYNALPNQEAMNSKESFATVEKNNKIKIYPNPVHDVLVVEGLSRSAVSTVSIKSLDGKLVQIHKVAGTINKLNIDDIQTGVYLLLIESGGKIYSEKFIKQ